MRPLNRECDDDDDDDGADLKLLHLFRIIQISAYTLKSNCKPEIYNSKALQTGVGGKVITLRARHTMEG